FLLAQDFGRDHVPPEDSGGGERMSAEILKRCQNAIKETQVLKDVPIVCRADGDKIVCVGTVPTKVHAGALYLTCLSVDGVKAIALAHVRIFEEIAIGMKPGEEGKLEKDERAEKDEKDEKHEGMGGAGGHEHGAGDVAAKKSCRLVAVVIDEDPSAHGEGAVKS